MESTTIAVRDVFDPRNTFEMTFMHGHDMFVNSVFVDANTLEVKLGQARRIYNSEGSPDYYYLYKQIAKALKCKKQLGSSELLQKPDLRLEDMEVVAFTDKVGDRSTLTLYRDEAGYMGLKTESTEYPELATGPVVWVCAPVTEESTSAMKNRARIFLPVFDLIKPLAAKYDRIQKGRDEERRYDHD